MCVLFFSTTIVWNISHTETNWEADDQNVYWSQCKVSVILQFSRQVFEKYSNIQFNVKPPSGIRIVPWGQTDRQTNMTKLIVFFFFCNIANAPEHKIRTGRSWRSFQTFFILIFPTPQCTWNSFIADTNLMSQGKSHCRTHSAILNIVYTTRTYCWHKCKGKQSHHRPGQALGFPGGWDSHISRQSVHDGGKVVSPTHRPPLPPPKKKIFLVLVSVRGWVNPRAIVRP